jgi:hypothetical protein
MMQVPKMTLALLSLLGCPGGPTSWVEADRGPIEATLDEVDETVWPGIVDADGGRYVRLLNGFFDGERTAYWFAGFASRVGADVFWFCREGDTSCPLDADGLVDRQSAVGNPVFEALPGSWNYSPFWLMWVVYVPDSYTANDLKSVSGIDAAAKAGRVSVEPFVFDHPETGPDLVMMHCLLALEGTELEGNGDIAFHDAEVPSLVVPAEVGWFEGYQVNYFEFNVNESVFPPSADSPSEPKFPFADIYVFFRDCEGGSTSTACDGTSGLLGAVSERGVELDLTDDGDKADNNNIISGFPGTANTNPLDLAYSPLWRVMRTRIPASHDADVVLIDSTVDQDESMVRGPDEIRELVDQGWLLPPETVSEAEASGAIPGNDNVLFFDCPSQVADL